MTHIPVLLQEVIEYLQAKQGGKFIDGTVGSGGHTIAILKSNPINQVLGIDLDQTSLDKLQEMLVQESLNQRATLVQGNYANLDKISAEYHFGSINGILLDLGFSSEQLDNPKRGLSFQTDSPLDMRFDPKAKITAAEIVNSYQPQDLEAVITNYGEEKFVRRIVANIIKQRQISPVQTTAQLSEIVRISLPASVRFKANDSIRRVFQAIRIEVNRELDNLKAVLPKALKLLKPGGRLGIISFHSLEDRIVKEFFNREAKDCVCPPEFPTCVCDKTSTLKILTRKPITARESEVAVNPRSKSAKLRVAEKIM